MINSTARESMLENAARDLLSIPPLLFREIRSRLIKMTLADTEVHISPLNYEIMSLLEDTGTIHIARIGEELHITGAQLTHLIEKLVGLNMVERKTGKADRRTANYWPY